MSVLDAIAGFHRSLFFAAFTGVLFLLPVSGSVSSSAESDVPGVVLPQAAQPFSFKAQTPDFQIPSESDWVNHGPVSATVQMVRGTSSWAARCRLAA